MGGGRGEQCLGVWVGGAVNQHTAGFQHHYPQAGATRIPHEGQLLTFTKCLPRGRHCAVFYNVILFNPYDNHKAFYRWGKLRHSEVKELA